MRHEPGFLSSRLHQSLNPQAKFRFVNVAQWESAQHFQTAMSKEAFQKGIGQMNYVAYPALYEIIAESTSKRRREEMRGKCGPHTSSVDASIKCFMVTFAETRMGSCADR